MLKLDNSLLDELGLGALPEDQKRAMLQHIYDTLELRVGTNLANQMSDQQLDEFEKFIDSGGDANQAQALQWLETNLPNYKQVVNDVFEALKTEIKQMAPQIVAASVPAQAPVAAPLQQTTPFDQGQPQVASHQQPVQSQPFQHAASANEPDMASTQGPAHQPEPYYGQGAQIYQFPAQQPPAGPGNHQQAPPRHPGDQQAA